MSSYVVDQGDGWLWLWLKNVPDLFGRKLENKHPVHLSIFRNLEPYIQTTTLLKRPGL
jgi:hypothetical protein